MQAIILAAGMGKRLKELTENNTKCMVKVNGVTLINRMLNQIDKQNVSRIIMVVGYKGDKLIEYVNSLNIKTPIIFIDNPIYDKTNNIYSLALAKDWLCKEDTLLFESDLIFEDSVLEMLVNDSRDTLVLVDKYESWMDGTCVKLGDDDSIEDFVPGKKLNFSECNEYYKTVNIYKFSKQFSVTHYVPFLEAYQSALGRNEYYEQVLRVITMLDNPEITAKRLTGQKWYEIDDIQDLDIAESIFTPDEEKRVHLLQERYGGYWRYPKLLDFCNLGNPFYPPQKMMDELKASFDILLKEYPSGMRVNSLLAAKNFSIHQENITVGNGSVELIKALMNYFSGCTGYICPLSDQDTLGSKLTDSLCFVPESENYSYTAQELMSFFEGKNINNLFIVNPDDFSGNYIPKSDIMRLIEWADEKGIRLIINESFVDFADETDSSLINQELISKYPGLYILKSLSKSYGVPGLRLSILVSGDTALISLMKKDVSIRKINSFGEFYMQIEEKYKKDYEKALVEVRAERKRFESELSKIDKIRVIPSQADFVVVELCKHISPRELLKRLLLKHNLLIKELAAKTDGRNYLRLALRKTEENNILLDALTRELERISL